MIYDGYENLGQQYERRRRRGRTSRPYAGFMPVMGTGEATIPTTPTTTTPKATVPFSPELKGQQHSAYGIPIGLSERERTDIFNVGQGQIQTATDVAMEQMREIMGSRGFRAGESGIADTILGSIAKEGQRTLSQFGKEMSIDEARRRFQEALAKAGFGLQEREFGLKEEGFEYGQEMEAIQMLMQMFFGGQQAQQARYEPYWAALVR